MCDCCVPYKDLTDEQKAEQREALATTFTGLPTVIGAPLILADEVWAEVADHQLELGVRSCKDIPPIKDWTAPTSEDVLDKTRAAGTWRYRPGYRDVETPRERIIRKAREQREEYEAEVARRRAAGELPQI